jgi:hypothetical protein
VSICPPGDGDPDVAYTLYERGSVQVSFGHGGVNDFQSSTETMIGRGAHGLAVGEIDGDGEPDLVATNALTNQLFVLYSSGSGTFGPEPYPVGNSPRNVTIRSRVHPVRTCSWLRRDQLNPNYFTG